MRKTKLSLEDLANLEEMTISIQPTDENWTTIKQFRKRNGTTITYYYLLKCKKCGNEQIATIGSMYKPKFKCETCALNSRIGEIHGPYEIISWDHDERGNIPKGKVLGKLSHYYKVKCIHCGKISVKQYNPNEWRKQNKCINCGENRINTNETNSLNGILATYKDGAKSRNIEWNLSNDDFVKLVTSNCIYCGAAPNIRDKYSKYYKINIPVTGIDRINSSKGYTVDNCVPCCSMCNKMKLNYTTDQFINKIKSIYFHYVEGSTTIENTTNVGSEQSTLQVNGSGNGGSPEMENDIV